MLLFFGLLTLLPTLFLQKNYIASGSSTLLLKARQSLYKQNSSTPVKDIIHPLFAIEITFSLIGDYLFSYMIECSLFNDCYKNFSMSETLQELLNVRQISNDLMLVVSIKGLYLLKLRTKAKQSLFYEIIDFFDLFKGLPSYERSILLKYGVGLDVLQHSSSSIYLIGVFGTEQVKSSFAPQTWCPTIAVLSLTLERGKLELLESTSVGMSFSMIGKSKRLKFAGRESSSKWISNGQAFIRLDLDISADVKIEKHAIEKFNDALPEAWDLFESENDNKILSYVEYLEGTKETGALGFLGSQSGNSFSMSMTEVDFKVKSLCLLPNGMGCLALVLPNNDKDQHCPIIRHFDGCQSVKPVSSMSLPPEFMLVKDKSHQYFLHLFQEEKEASLIVIFSDLKGLYLWKVDSNFKPRKLFDLPEGTLTCRIDKIGDDEGLVLSAIVNQKQLLIADI